MGNNGWRDDVEVEGKMERGRKGRMEINGGGG